jgi:hypothetical protein
MGRVRVKRRLMASASFIWGGCSVGARGPGSSGEPRMNCRFRKCSNRSGQPLPMRRKHHSRLAAIAIAGLLLAASTLAGAVVQAEGADAARSQTSAPVPQAVADLLRARGYRTTGPATQRGRVVVVEADDPAGRRVLLVVDPHARDIAGQKPMPAR